MASVAGAIAWAGVEAMVDAGALFGVIDNGGDIALISDCCKRVGVHAGAAVLSNRIAFVVPPQEKILGICTSSATVGPPSHLGVQMLLRYSLMMLRLPMPGLPRSATRSGPMTRRFSTG